MSDNQRTTTQKRKEANRKKNEALHKAKTLRRANGTLTETDRMWEAVKAKFEQRRQTWLLERQGSDWSKTVGRVKGKRITLAKAQKPVTPTEQDGGTSKPRQKRPKKEKTRA